MASISVTPEGKTVEVKSGLAGFCSWRRLQEIMRRAGELSGSEQVTSFHADERGVTFYVKTGE